MNDVERRSYLYCMSQSDRRYAEALAGFADITSDNDYGFGR